MAALGQAMATFRGRHTMTGYLLLTKGEDSLARRGALVIIRAVCRSEIGNLGRGLGMSWRAKLTSWARRRKSSRLSQRQLYHDTMLAIDYFDKAPSQPSSAAKNDGRWQGTKPKGCQGNNAQ